MPTTTKDSEIATEPQALVDQLTESIRRSIMTGEFELGSRLQQAALAEQFEVSRTPIREALRKLESEGLVELLPHRGAVVRGPTAREIREAYEVRAELEGLAAQRAAEWISEEQLDRLSQANARFQKYADRVRTGGRDKADADEWVLANDTFHSVLQESARNDQLVRAIRNLHQSFPRNLTGLALSKDARLAERNAEEHKRVLTAVESGDGIEARRAMTEHVKQSGELVAMWFELYSENPGRR